MNLPRTSGVLLHPTSLPSGRLGPEAFAWVDWLAAAGQTWWQMLPLSPPDKHGSPYKSASAFAASPALLAEPDAPVTDAERDAFRAKASDWIEDWIAFAGESALDDQVRFDREWAELRRYAADRGVRLIGDVPIYVAPDSADERAHPEIFKPGFVAGVPPDAFTEDGQLWGNPVYDWPALQRRGYSWWIARLRRIFELFDLVRIDHFRAFTAYWAVPEDSPVASAGTWKRGPGAAPLLAAREALGGLPVIAEDLGVITPPVKALRESLGLPGMAVLQFGFTPGERDTQHVCSNHEENQVVYTGTHDNDTIRGWYDGLGPEQLALVQEAWDEYGISEDEPHWGMIRLALASPARLAMVQLQDVLGLGNEGRMNQPGTAGGWGWKLDELPSADLARRLRAATEAAGRSVS
ncbi:4-alpha-glucanotransferase [Solirubrobacter sp. CPCC 204708]|uniref:4-alpha-glucanotransferase n=1 Tax=Solirubrobacter deserti TaxID=2282478 RepID=A0ABT4RRN8_9ACTN|nr:4-alpha-glucanotransferase [Solirubrobacter deserti]MBE2317573.1 4-alpha-glucanotransferase [Solirubrobacter deserti]MDA0141267.1 4-alpha-glucanotransferase [Solirubrobacter deserti]